MTTPTRIPPNNIPMDQMRTRAPIDGIVDRMQAEVGTRRGNRTLDMIAATGISAEEAVETAGSEYATGSFLSHTAPTLDPAAAVEQGAQQGLDPTSVIEGIHNMQGQIAGHEAYGDFVLEGYLANGSPEMHAAEVNIYRNQQIMMEVLQDRFQSWDDRTNAGLVWDFVDRYFLTYFLPGGAFYEDLTLRGERNGLEVLQHAATMNAEEFRQYAEQFADDAVSEGLFNDNYFAMQQALGEAQNNGYDPEARMAQNFAVFDAMTVALPAATRVLRGLRRMANRGTGAISRASAVAGVTAADEVAEALIRGGASAVESTVDDLLPGQVALGRRPGTVTARTSRAVQILTNNPLLRRITNLYQQGAFGVRATAEEIEQEAARTIARINSNFDDPVITTDVVQLSDVGDYGVQVTVGRPVIGIEDGGGLPFRTADAAESFAARMVDEGMAAEVRAVDPNDASLGFHVVLTERLDLTRVASAFDVGSVSQSLLLRAFGRAHDDAGFSDLAQLGEAGVNQITQEVAPYLARVRVLDADGRFALDRVFTRARDGQDSALGRNYTREEFNIVWREEHPTGLRATDADWNAYQAANTISDAAYILQADRILQRYVTGGYQAVQFNGFRTPARVVSNVAEDAPVMDAATGRTAPRGRLSDDATIWELESPAGDVRYVTNPEVRILEFDDVLGYNSGGRRTNPDAYHFVTLGDNAIMSAFTEGASVAARNSLRAIREVFQSTGLRLGDLTDELDAVLAANRSWHHGIENTEDFVAWIRREGIEESFEDDTIQISRKARDDIIEGNEMDVWNGMAYGDRVAQQQSRRARPLTEVGGGTGRQHSPTATMVSQLNDAATEYAFRASTQRAKASWMKRFLNTDRLPDGMDINAAFARAGNPTAKNRNGRELRAMRAMIERREGLKSAATQAIEDMGDRVREWVFDRSGRRWGRIDVNSWQNKLLTFGFHSAFGFMNLAQLPLQASHIGAIAAISPRQGLRAARDVLPIRLAMSVPEGPMRDLAVRNLARVIDMTEDEITTYWQYLRSSGRDLVDGAQLEKGTGAGFGISGFDGRDLRPSFLRRQWVRTERARGVASTVSIAPFNEGERLSRHTAILTAYREFIRSHPGVSPMSPQGRAWISAREQKLTYNMTTASRGAWQTGAMRIPTQWLSYTMRSFENIVIGRNFTKAERARLAIWTAVSGGMAGLGLHSAVDSIGEWLGVEPGGLADVSLRYGLIDGILSWGLSEMSGEEIRTAMGTRIAPFTALAETHRRITEENFAAVVAGPSGEMAGGFVDALFSVAGGVLNGTWAAAEEDIERVLRTPGGLNNFFTAQGIVNYGIYRGRSGTTLPMRFTDTQGLLQFAGITQFEVAEFYARRGQSFRDSEELRNYTNRIRNRWREAIVMVNQDREAGLQLMRDIGVMINLSGFSPYDQMQIRAALTADSSNDLMALALEALQQDNRYGAQVIESLD